MTYTRWGVATIERGIYRTASTRREALIHSGIDSGYTRHRDGALYEYRSATMTVVIGRVGDLRRAGFLPAWGGDTMDDIREQRRRNAAIRRERKRNRNGRAGA